jgi:hypothetical protein
VTRLRGYPHRYRCLPVPSWACSLSLADIVVCRPGADGEGLFVGRVPGESGNRAVRAGFKGPQRAAHPRARLFRAWLGERSLGSEFLPPDLFAVNVPTPAAYQQVAGRLRRIPPGADMIGADGTRVRAWGICPS